MNGNDTFSQIEQAADREAQRLYGPSRNLPDMDMGTSRDLAAQIEEKLKDSPQAPDYFYDRA